MSSESDVTRRDFLKTAAKTTGAAGAFSGLTFLPRPERVFGANDRVRVAVCGLHGRGKDHLDAFARVPNVEVAALCDVDETLLDKRRGEVRSNPRTFIDVRRLLEDPSIDAISIATPNHWHALIAIWACQAGKDVYVEKPCSHNLWEGRQLVRAAAKYSRIVQHGTQSRSARAQIEAIDHLHKGTFGDIYLARGVCFKRRDTIGRTPAEAMESTTTSGRARRR
jgi:predicted dehydrogenase